MCELCAGKEVTDEKMQALVSFIEEQTKRWEEEIKQIKQTMAKAFIVKAEELDLPADAVEYASLAAAVKMGKMAPGDALIRGLAIMGGRFDIRNI